MSYNFPIKFDFIYAVAVLQGGTKIQKKEYWKKCFKREFQVISTMSKFIPQLFIDSQLYIGIEK